MAVTPTAGHIAGLYHAQIAFRSTDGYPMGADSTPDDVAAGETKHAYRLTGPVSVTSPAVTREVATFRGGQVVLGQRSLGVSEFGTFEMTLSAFDEVFNAYVSGSSVNTTTMTEYALGAPNSLRPDLPQFILLLTAGFQTTGATQQNQFVTYVYPNVQITPALAGATQDGGVNPNPLTYTVTPSASRRAASGHLFSALNMGLQDGKEIVYWLRGQHPVALTTYIQAASATTFTLGYRPVSSNVGGGFNIFTTNGVTTTVSSVNVTTGVVTITPASADDIWVALYATQFEAI